MRQRHDHKKFRQYALYTLFLILFLGPHIIMSFSDMYFRHSKPVIVDSVMDMSQTDLSKEKNGIQFTGDLEFYYNEWLVSEPVTNPTPTGVFHAPGYWTQADNSVSREGYGSYRFTMTGLKPGMKLALTSQFYHDSFRVYFGDTLVATSGTVSKERSTNRTQARLVNVNSYMVSQTGVVVVTIEAGNNNNGGLFRLPIVYDADKFDINNNRRYIMLLYILLGLLVAASLLVFLVNWLQHRSVKSFIFWGTSVSMLLLNWLFSPPGVNLLRVAFKGISYTASQNILMVSQAVFLILSVIKLYREKGLLRQYRGWLLFDIISTAVFLALSHILHGYRFMAFPMICFAIMNMVYIFWLARHTKGHESRRFHIEVLLAAAFGGIALVEDMEIGASFAITTMQFMSLSILLMVALEFIFIWGTMMHLRASENQLNSLLQQEDVIKDLALKEQLNPNYLFNMLNIIEDVYHQDIAKGEYALDLFAKTLRYGIDTMEVTYIPFDDEVEALLDYVDLANVNSDHPMELILNLDVTEFRIPPLVLRPFAEQALMRHRLTRFNGTIKLSTLEDGNDIIVVIHDLENGYDIDLEYQPISNALKRMELLLDSTYSTVNKGEEGTITTFRFRNKEKNTL